MFSDRYSIYSSDQILVYLDTSHKVTFYINISGFPIGHNA